MIFLEFTYRENNKKSDPFERWDRLVLDSLNNIALFSDENYIQVRRTIQTFIKDYSDVYQHVNWLNAFLDQLEQKYYVNKSEKYEIENVIEKLGNVSF